MTRISQTNREIHDWLQAQGPAKLDAVQHRFRNLALALGKGGPQFIITRLNALREQGLVRRIFIDGIAHWDAVRDEGDDAVSIAHQPERMALPRRVDMFGPVYVPPKLVVRPGAMDHAAVPSLRLGKREPFSGSYEGRSK